MWLHILIYMEMRATMIGSAIRNGDLHNLASYVADRRPSRTISKYAFKQAVYAMPALISHASGFCGLYCTYGRATWGKRACTKLFIATLQM